MNPLFASIAITALLAGGAALTPVGHTVAHAAETMLAQTTVNADTNTDIGTSAKGEASLSADVENSDQEDINNNDQNDSNDGKDSNKDDGDEQVDVGGNADLQLDF